MLITTKQQEELLVKYMPNYKEFDEFGEFLLALDEVMLESLDENYEGTDETTVISRLYDEIYAANTA